MGTLVPRDAEPGNRPPINSGADVIQGPGSAPDLTQAARAAVRSMIVAIPDWTVSIYFPRVVFE